MKLVSTSDARKRISQIVESVKVTGRSIAIGRRNKPEVIVTPYSRYNPALNEITNFAAASGSFDFLWDEPNLYSDKDIKWRYGKPHKRKTA